MFTQLKKQPDSLQKSVVGLLFFKICKNSLFTPIFAPK
jgi:hypothetical protein